MLALTGFHSILGYVLLMDSGSIQRLDDRFYHCLLDQYFLSTEQKNVVFWSPTIKFLPLTYISFIILLSETRKMQRFAEISALQNP